jgi:uncharacterized membrane-anchored protein YhcB (DUF1043 family)
VESDSITIGTWIIPLVIGGVIMPFILRALNQYTKTSQDSLSGNIRIENLQVDLSGVKREMNDMYNRLEKVFNNTDAESRKIITELSHKVDALITKTEVHEYRLTTLEDAVSALRDINITRDRRDFKRDESKRGAV